MKLSKYVRVVSNGFLYALKVYLVNLELPKQLFLNLFQCLRETLVVSVVSRGFFVSSETLMGSWVWSKVRGNGVAVLSLKILEDVLSFSCSSFQETLFFLNNNCSNISVIKSEKQNLYKNRW